MKVCSFNKPVIGAISGWALAGGCELAMACDILISSDDAQFGEPEIRFGSGPVTILMPFIIGQKKTNELLLTGDLVSAQEALALGMINKVVPKSELLSEAERMATKIAVTPLQVLRFTKRGINRSYEAMGLREAVQSNLDVAAILNSVYSEERKEFTRLVSETGLRSALAWRDARYSEHG
jgi:enoyl-CoA hydratase